MHELSNRDIADILSETAKLMELHNANEFKLKSLQNAAFVISRLESPLLKVPANELELIKGIGKSISQKIIQILETGTLEEHTTFIRDTPSGVVEMMRIKGVGPKKVSLLWKQLGVETPGELLYACNENRLVELKGFGAKTQDQIKKAIEYMISSRGYFHYATLEPVAQEIVASLEQSGLFSKVSLTGAIRRKCEILQEIEIIVAAADTQEAASKIPALEVFSSFQATTSGASVRLTGQEGLVVTVTPVSEADFFRELVMSTGNAGHIELLGKLEPFSKLGSTAFDSEEKVYNFLGLPFIEPELREGLDETGLALNNTLPQLVSFEDLRGSLHNHSTYSDGMHSLREMAVACKNLGYEYLGICDHSKSAFYANGLSEERIIQQHEEIDLLNKELAPFRIFKGIESDILHNGNLDYPDSVLEKFDFIVASIHSGLKMTEEKATARLLAAISNPHTTILGHPTGRLLLAREGYPINHKAVIDACAQHQVIIELNAHPYRLDLDWRWIRYALSKNVMISINPDAHHISGYHDMYFGTCVARKGYLTKNMTFNALAAADIERWFLEKKQAGQPVR
jgi:DNA polymerase (family 10)